MPFGEIWCCGILNLEFNIVVDIYGPPDKTGRPKLIKKGVIYKKSFDPNLVYPEEYLDKKGKIVKKYTSIEYGDKYYTLAHNIEYVKKALGPLVINGLAGKARYNKK